MEILEDLVFNDFAIPALLLFVVGLVGVLFKKNLLIIFMCIEMMMCASLLLVASVASKYLSVEGLVLSFFILAIGACEVAIALAIIIQRYKLKQKPFLDELNMDRE